MFRRSRKGFTLVEIMIVVAIIALLAAMAIPNLLRSRLQAEEAAAVSAVQTLVSAQTSWRGFDADYATMAELGGATPPYIDAALTAASGAAGCTNPKGGYCFEVPANTATQFRVVAVDAQTGGAAAQRRTFFADEGGVIYSAAAGTVDPGASYGGGDPDGAAALWNQVGG